MVAEDEVPRRPRRLLLAAALVVAVATAALSAVALAATSGGASPPAIAVGLGDIVKVAGAPIGCAIRREGGVRALDCRRIGPLRGTYGAILTNRQLVVVRFGDKSTATIVFSARHGSTRAHTCG